MEDERGNSSGLWRDLAGHVRSSNQLLGWSKDRRSGGLAGRGGPLGAEGYARGGRLGPCLLPSSEVLDGRGGGRESLGGSLKFGVWSWRKKCIEPEKKYLRELLFVKLPAHWLALPSPVLLSYLPFRTRQPEFF